MNHEDKCVLFSHLLCLKSSLEEMQKRCEAEAIHVVDLGQVRDDKVHLAGTLSKRKVCIPLLQQENQSKRQIDRVQRERKPMCSRNRNMFWIECLNGKVHWKTIDCRDNQMRCTRCGMWVKRRAQPREIKQTDKKNIKDFVAMLHPRGELYK